MEFQSILSERGLDRNQIETAQPPDFFIDLNLDQVIDAVTATKQEYDLKPYFYLPLHELEAVQYRHQVMQELEQPPLFESIKSFEKKMRAVREHLAQAAKLYYKHQKERWFLEAVAIYCDAVHCLAEDLTRLDVRARGLASFREYLTNYARSDPFTSLWSEAKGLLDDLAAIRYTVLINGTRVLVRKYAGEADYSVRVEETFERFKQGAAKDYRVKFLEGVEMNHVEAQILEGVAQLHPEVFSALDNFCSNHRSFLDETTRVFDREIQFYVAYLECIAALKRAGLHFCYPTVSAESKQVSASDGFDLALALKLVNANAPIICNDFSLRGAERIIVVTGPNQGGKTTFARMFGQLHFLGSLGCPVPGSQARLFLPDRLFTHFERQESIETLRGKLEDDLIRIHEVLERATPHSIILLNEIFTSTTLQDALFLSKELLGRIIELDLLCVCVTFLDELASLSEKTVSLVSTVDPENPELRTFKILPKPADGLAYALSLARKYRVTHDHILERTRA